MTVSNTASVVVVQGNGAQTVFNYGFEIPTGGGYALYLRDSAGGIGLLAPSSYSVSGVGNSTGGTFTYPLAGNTPLAAGNSLIFLRVTPNEQLTALGNQSAFYPQVVEAALDWLTFQAQETVNQLGLAIQAPAGDAALNPLATAALRANGYLGFDANGQPEIVAGTAGVISISSAMVPLVQAASVASALALLFATPGPSQTLAGALTVDGEVIANAAGTSLSTAQNAVIGGNATVSGNATVDGTLTVDGEVIVPAATAASNPVQLAQVQNTAPLGATATSSSATTISATTGTFTAPSTGLLVAVGFFGSQTGLASNTTTASLGAVGGVVSTPSSYSGSTGTGGMMVVTLAMNAGQTTTVTFSCTQASAGYLAAGGFLLFIPLG